MDVAVIGAGPAGLMAAEVLAQGGARVTVFDAMPSAGRKLLMAGCGGLNLTTASRCRNSLRAIATRRDG
jgi:predicted flavoprotein YhiN